MVPDSVDRFDWWDEERFKWGWWSNSTSPGASITLHIPTGSTIVEADDETVLLAFGCTRSGTKPMGSAQVLCVSGCTCEPQTCQGSWDQQNSLTALVAFRVSQHPDCRVQFKVCELFRTQNAPPCVRATQNLLAKQRKLSACGRCV